MSSTFRLPAPIATSLGEGWTMTSVRKSSCGDLQTLLAAASQAANHEYETTSDDVKSQPPTKKKRVYKKRKSTHTVRKEESHALETEIQGLEAKLEALKLRALIDSGDEDTSLRKQIAHNSLLRDDIQEQHLVTAKAQAMLVGCTQQNLYNIRPNEMYIHLPADHLQRLKTLETLRGPKLQCARHFIQQRSLGLHPTADYFNEERFETPEGDFCNVRFDRLTLKGVAGGVCAVFEALKYTVFNAEIVLSEASGYITVREDDAMDTIDNFSHMRLVTQSALGVLVENNVVHFSELVQADNQSDTYALATVDFVDQDDRFPYRPHECIRRDATSVVLLTNCTDSG